MNATEIVVGKPQREVEIVIRPLLRKSIGQSGISSRTHSRAEVVAFDVRGRNLRHIGVAVDRNLSGSRAFSRRVSRLALRIVRIEFYELCEVNALRSETQDNRVLIGFESVCCDLEVSLSGAGQFVSELNCVGFGSFAKVPSQDQFAIALNRSEDPTITNAFIFKSFPTLGLLLHSDVLPLLITLDLSNTNAFNTIIHKILAPLARKGDEVQNRSNVNASNSRCAAKRAAFYQVLQHRQRFVLGQNHIAKQPRAGFEKRLLARQAAIALLALTILAEPFGSSIADLTVHFESLSSATREYHARLSIVNIFVLLAVDLCEK